MSMTTRGNFAIAPVLLATMLALSACSSQAPDGEHAASGSSSAGLPAGNINAGEQQANAKGAATGQSCIDCHGTDGNAPIDPSYPVIGGQYADYLAHALQGYRNGTREHVLMSSQAKDLTDQQIANLSAFFASRDSDLVNLSGSHDK